MWAFKQSYTKPSNSLIPPPNVYVTILEKNLLQRGSTAFCLALLGTVSKLLVAAQNSTIVNHYHFQAQNLSLGEKKEK
jgi:hypothetical protein